MTDENAVCASMITLKDYEGTKIDLTSRKIIIIIIIIITFLVVIIIIIN